LDDAGSLELPTAAAKTTTTPAGAEDGEDPVNQSGDENPSPISSPSEPKTSLDATKDYPTRFKKYKYESQSSPNSEHEPMETSNANPPGRDEFVCTICS